METDKNESVEIVDETSTATAGSTPRKSRRDRGRTHATKSGLLSKDILQALVRTGENLRSIRRQEKRFRKFVRPRGTLGELLFDRFWSAYLRLLLIARLEGKLLTSDYSRQSSKHRPELRERKLPTLVSNSDLSELDFPDEADGEFSQNLFHELALAQRYDAHYAREARQMLTILLGMRKRGIDDVGEGFADKYDLRRLKKEKI
jgi:hypothetical protein